MEGAISVVIYVLIVIGVLISRKKFGTKMTQNEGAMPHKHKSEGRYDTFNKKSWKHESGAMPHKHEKGHYTSMSDASKLPKGYILLNGEPVRVADLEDK